MRILALTDLHGDAGRLDEILAAAGPADLILLGGDITNFGSPEDVECLVRQAQASGPPVLAVAGNCDSAAIDARLGELGVSLHGRGVLVGNLAIQGLSGIPPWTSRMYGFSEEQLAAALESGYDELSRLSRDVGRSSTLLHVVLTHVPPQGTRLDRTLLFQHVGSAALRAFVEARQPDLVLSGHVHEARGIEQIGRTTAVNCGPAVKGSYALIDADEAVRVDLRRV